VGTPQIDIPQSLLILINDLFCADSKETRSEIRKEKDEKANIGWIERDRESRE